MPDPNIDNNLLERFHQGYCTAAEREAVMRWLENDEDDIETLSGSYMAEVEERIWANIDPKKVIQLKIRHIITWTGIAASILLICSWWLVQGPSEQISSATYALGGGRTSSLEVNGVRFRSVGNSNATLTTGHNEHNGDLTFCGVIEISNDSDTDVHYNVNYSCKADGPSQKRITLKKGGSYVAMQDHGNAKQLIILRKEQLNEFPDALPPGFERI